MLGCAIFHDILKPAATLCKVLQSDEICAVSAIEAILKTTKSMEKLKDIEIEDFPTLKKVLSRVKDEDGHKSYQGFELTHYQQGWSFIMEHATEYLQSVLDCLHERLKWKKHPEDVLLLNHILKILATHGWEKTESAAFGYESVQHLSTRFAIPLQEAGVNSSQLQDEWEDIVFFAKQYINLVQNSYKIVWWKLFNSPDAPKWKNILTLVELFSILLSNGRLECCFSQLKITKTDRRASLKEDSLDHLLRIRIEGPPLEEWNPSKAMGLWWADKPRRVNRSQSATTSATSSDVAEEECAAATWTFADWDSWLEPA